MNLSSWLRRRAPATNTPRTLVSSVHVIERYRRAGADREAALCGTLSQVRGLRDEVADDLRWAALVELVRRTGDPWNAEDWPLGFDALVCCVSLCTHVDYECARCPVGRNQEGMSCAHPATQIGRISELVRAALRAELLEHLDRLEHQLVTLLRHP